VTNKNSDAVTDPVEHSFPVGETVVVEAPVVLAPAPELVVEPVQPDMDAILQYNAALLDLWRKHVWMRPTGLMHEICFIPDDVPGDHMKSAIHLLEMALAKDGKVYIHKNAVRRIDFPNLRKDGKFGDYLIFVRK
jgi:hypothetical protein